MPVCHERRGCAVDDVDLEEGAVIIAHVKVKQLVVVAQHRGDHIDRRIVDTGFAHGRQRCKDFDTVAHIFELRIDAACGALCNLVNEGPGGGANDRCDACETEIDQRQSDDQDDRHEQRDDRCSEAQLHVTQTVRHRAPGILANGQGVGLDCGPTVGLNIRCREVVRSASAQKRAVVRYLK